MRERREVEVFLRDIEDVRVHVDVVYPVRVDRQDLLELNLGVGEIYRDLLAFALCFCA